MLNRFSDDPESSLLINRPRREGYQLTFDPETELQERYHKDRLDDYWERERDDVLSALQAIMNDLASSRYQPTSVLGVGGSGIVIRLHDTKFQHRDKALKFPRPVPGKVALISEMVTKEIAHLSQLRHPGLVTILDHNMLTGVTGYPSLPYYLMEYVDGKPSRDFVRQDSTSEPTFNSIILSAARTLNYLASSNHAGFVHLDIKPDNIMVTREGSPVFIDLGTCKRLQDGPSATMVMCTRSFAHPVLIRRLAKDPSDENRSKGDIPRSDIDPAWDLWSFGLTLLDWIGLDPDDGEVLEGAIYPRLSPYSRKYYLFLAARLLSYSPRDWLTRSVKLSVDVLKDFPVTDSHELCDILGRLNGSNQPLASIPEVSAHELRTIQAASGRHVPITPRLKLVLEHRLFRRLNNITQLGLVSQVYPGAKHTRREHSLGTYANTCLVLQILYDDPFSPLFRQIIREKDCLNLLLVSLLHDLGQFPLAHDLEEIDSSIFDHNELTNSMLRGEWAKKKRGARKIEFDSLLPIFEAWKSNYDDLITILDARSGHTSAGRREKLLRSIISGAVDADKLDYLFRDARHTDVPYPLGVDVERLLQTLTVAIVGRVEGGARDVPTLAVHAKGRVAAEYLTIARYAMFSQVYWHHTVRAQKAMLFRAVEGLLGELRNHESRAKFKTDFLEMVSDLPESLYLPEQNILFPETPGRMKLSNWGAGTDLSPTDAAVLSWFREKLVRSDRPEAALIDGILHRRLFKRLWVVSMDMEETRWKNVVSLWEQLGRVERYRASLEFERDISREMKTRGARSVTKMKAEAAKEIIDDSVAAEVPWLLIDIPGARPGAEVGLHYVLEGQRRSLRKEDQAVGDLQSSQVWDQYAKHLREAAGKIRVFCDPELVDSVEASVEWQRAMDLLEAVFQRARQ